MSVSLDPPEPPDDDECTCDGACGDECLSDCYCSGHTKLCGMCKFYPCACDEMFESQRERSMFKGR